MLGLDYWVAAGDGYRWVQNLTYNATTFPSAKALVYSIPGTTPPTIRAVIGGVRVFQMSYSNLTSRESSSTGYNTGHYLLASHATNQASASSRLMAATVGLAGIGGGGTGIYEAVPQWKELIKSDGVALTQGDVQPSTDAVWWQRAIHQTGFVEDMGGPRQAYTPANDIGIDTACTVMVPTVAPTTYYLWHYSPWAWFGTVPAVVASIAMKCGLTADKIDATSFYDADAAYDLASGDPPYTTAVAIIGNYVHQGLDSKYEIGCSRVIGDRCMDLIKKCIAHSRDIYFVNEQGRLSIQSYTRPAKVTSLLLSDGVIGGSIEWKYNSALMFNVAYTSWGSGVLTSGDPSPGEELFVNPLSAVDESRLESYAGDGMSAVSATQASMDKYGNVCMRGIETDVNVRGELRRAQLVHYPFLFSCHAIHNGNIPHIATWMRSTGKIYRTVTITQDFRALDWGIGAKVTNVAVTDDGQIIPEMWCIERTYDFDRLTVTSVLMEQPLNT